MIPTTGTEADTLSGLRQQLHRQQFTELLTNVESYWQESADVQALPLLALAHAHANSRKAVKQTMALIKPHRNALLVDALSDLAGVLIYLGRIPQAVLLLNAVLEKNHEHAQAKALLAWCKVRSGQLDEGLALYQESFDSAPEIFSTGINLVKARLDQKEFARAQTTLDELIASFEYEVECLQEDEVANQTLLLRKLQLRLWRDENAIATAEEWLERRREDLEESVWVPLVSAWASLLSEVDQYAQAENALRSVLEHYPNNVAVLHQLSEHAQLQGRFWQASNLLRRAARLAKKQNLPATKQITLLVKYSDACLNSENDSVRARKAVAEAAKMADELSTQNDDDAVDISPTAIRRAQMKSRLALAKIESHEQNYELAETLYLELLEEDPYFVPALQSLGQQYMQQGRIDQAIGCFDRVKDIDPARGYASLINVRQFPDDEAVLERMESVARTPGPMGSVNSHMLFQLAMAWEKQQNYDKAFELAKLANDSNLAVLSYDANEHRQKCARIRYAFPQELYEQRPDRGVGSSLPVFVVGMPRSGTTLVEQILAGHSKICGAGELGVIPQTIAGIERWERHVGSGRSYPDCIDDLSPYVSAGIANNVLKELQEYDPEAEHVIDKLPHNFQNIGLIKFLFPNARIISVRRDSRDIAVSNYFTDYHAKHGGMGFAYDLENIGRQLADHNLMMHHWNEVFPGEILEVSYETLISDIEGCARQMLDYIGVDWEPDVIAFNELERPVKTASVWQVRQPVYKSSKGKWARYKDHLRALYSGTNARIEHEAIEMISLPEPGLLNTAVDLYEQRRIDDAEYEFKKLLHHIPEHAAAGFMVGLIYFQKGHTDEGIDRMEKAHQQCPWNRNWRSDLIQAHEMLGNNERAAQLKEGRSEIKSSKEKIDKPAEHVA